MNEEDQKIWELYARGVRKIASSDPAPPLAEEMKKTEEPRGPAKEEKKEPVPRIEPSVPASPPLPARQEPLDVRIERNLSLGDVVVEARLDLHGKTEADAHAQLLSFIDKQHGLGKRLVLAITGKGRDGASVLRANLPRWCEVSPLCEKVSAVRTAAAHHGGEGAYYLLLRKKK